MTPIRDLRPLDDTAAAIKAALSRIAAERQAAEREIAAAAAARAHALTTGTPTEIGKAEDSSRKFRLHAEQLDALNAHYRPMLEQAVLKEDVENYDRARAAFDEKCARLREFVEGRYLEIISELTEFFDLENDAILDAARLSGMRAARLGKRPGEPISIAQSMPKGFVRHDVPGLPFGFAIKLPNVARGNWLWKQEKCPVVPPNLAKYR